MTIKAIVHVAEEGGFWAEVPALPGCVTQGETMEEIQANLREAIDLWLSVDEPVAPLAADDRVLELAVGSKSPAGNWRKPSSNAAGPWHGSTAVITSSSSPGIASASSFPFTETRLSRPACYAAR